MYNTNNLNVAKVASKTTIKPVLNAVAFYKNKTVATDSFHLLEMSTVEEIEGMSDDSIIIPLQNLKAIEKAQPLSIVTLKTLHTFEDETFPEYEHLMPKIETEMLSQSFNVDLLIEGLTVLKKMKNKFGRVTIHTFGGYKPLMITAENEDTKQKARYIIMPLTN